MENLKRVVATRDDSGHWYVLPIELQESFDKDVMNEDMCDSGEFDEKYGEYRTGGGLNLVELYAAV